MKHCDYCQDPAVYLVTVKDGHGEPVATFNELPVCEDHLEEIDTSVQMVNQPKKDGHYTFTKTRMYQ